MINQQRHSRQGHSLKKKKKKNGNIKTYFSLDTGHYFKMIKINLLQFHFC